jgi:type IV secretory pathway VirB3-like protein
MERVRQVAFISVGRAVGFAGLAIFTVMIGLCFDPLLALRSGGVLLLLLIAVLLMKAQLVETTDYRHTEAWLLLDRHERPEERLAGPAMSTALHEALLWFARWAAGVAALVWSGAVLLMLLGSTA